METKDYLLLGFILVLVVGGLILNPAIAIAILFFLFIHSRVKKQQSENDKFKDYYRFIQDRKLNAYNDTVNKRVERKEERYKRTKE